MRHVAGSLEAGDRALERFDGLGQAAGFAGRHGPAQKDEREGRILLGRERLRAVEQLQCPGRVEPERALTGEQRIAGRTRRYLGLEGGVGCRPGEGERLARVVRELLDLLAGLGFQPVRGRQVLCRTRRARDLLVDDVPDQQVPEPVLALALHRRLAGGPHELLACELVQRPLDLVRIAVVHRADRAGPEDLAQHRRVLEKRLALLRERVEAGRDQRVDRLRERHIRALLSAPCSSSRSRSRSMRTNSSAYSGLPPARSRRSCCVSAGSTACSQQGGDELCRVRVRQRREVDRRVVAQPGAPGRMRLVQLGPGGADDEQRDTLRPVGQVLEKREQRRVGPVDVLHHQHQRSTLRRPTPGTCATP